ncbi:MAG: D-alanine--D-alanine ligase, partial [Bacteroidales bacterium]|nr:D-alanine--D-alanine ligase [Bacteroidales bacterium]
MKNIAVLAGGNSGEYEVSLKTAQNICNILDKKQFTPYFIHVKDLEWSYTDDLGNTFGIDKNDFTLMLSSRKVYFDVAFIAIHGNPGEDGKMQGYFDMLHIPYTGCDCFCSALTFNKYFCNVVVSNWNVPVAPSLHFYKDSAIDLTQIEAVCGYPCFVKPCNSGSSVGVTKVH